MMHETETSAWDHHFGKQLPKRFHSGRTYWEHPKSGEIYMRVNKNPCFRNISTGELTRKITDFFDLQGCLRALDYKEAEQIESNFNSNYSSTQKTPNSVHAQSLPLRTPARPFHQFAIVAYT